MATFGETLKRERELRKITLREVSEATKIGLKYLEALEANRFDHLPGGLFNKGFIRAYAKFIGLDGEALVNAYLFDLNSQQNPPSARPRYAGFSIEETAPPVPPVEKKAAHRPGKWVLAGLAAAAALVAAAAFWQIGPGGHPAPPRPAPAIMAEPDRGGIAGGATRATAPAPSGAPLPAGLDTQRLAAAGDGIRPAPEPEVLSLALSASETTWIAITCDGTERLNKEIAGGDTVRLSCRDEIRLSSGNAGTITVRINGNDCVPLGKRGEVIRDFLFDQGRSSELCPPPSQER